MNEVQIGGKKRPVRFSYLCLKEICIKTGLKLNELDKLGSEFDHMSILTYYGLKYGAKKAGLVFESTIDDIENWLDDEGLDVLTEIFEAFKIDQPQKKRVK
tara:strand:+ start:1606 stop:1908 length:303 start_codon:yes stop_codon:yes gene_type:complete